MGILKNKQQISQLIFLVLGSLLAAVIIWAGYAGLRNVVYCCKILIMAVLICGVIFSKCQNKLYMFAITGGLLLSGIGDAFLMLPADLFIAGLTSFLLAHCAYILAFSHGKSLSFPALPTLVLAIYVLVLFRYLLPSLGAMKLPVLAYATVIGLMALQAWSRWKSSKSISSFTAFVGAAFFVVSDSVLAVSRFKTSGDWSIAGVLGTYYVAQLLIAYSVLMYKKQVQRVS